jgi:hypothetical protein
LLYAVAGGLPPCADARRGAARGRRAARRAERVGGPCMGELGFVVFLERFGEHFDEAETVLGLP